MSVLLSLKTNKLPNNQFYYRKYFLKEVKVARCSLEQGF